MVSDAMVERAWKAFMDLRNIDPKESMRAALESVEGNFEQKIANDQVRRLRDNGVCPTCGHEPAANLMD